MDVSVVALCSICGTGLSIVLGYAGYQRLMKNDNKVEGQEAGEQKATLEFLRQELKINTDYIRNRIDDVLLEQRETNKQINNHATWITRVEESAKSAHHRIDRLEKIGVGAEKKG